MFESNIPPFFRLLMPVVIGILMATYVPALTPIPFAIVGAFMWLVFVFIRERDSYWFPYVFGVALFFSFTAISIFLAGRQNDQLVDSIENKGVYLVEINEHVIPKSKSVQLFAKVYSENMPNSFKSILYLQKDENSIGLKDGDFLIVDGKFFGKGNTTTSDVFDFDKYLKAKGFSGSYYVPSYGWKKFDFPHNFSIFRQSRLIQKYLVGLFQQSGINGDELAVLSALTIGDKTLLDKDLKRVYSSAGASHILAVSGLHVGVVYWVFLWMMSLIIRTEKLKILKTTVPLAALWSYAFITGLSPSVVRASIMLTIATLAVTFGRKPQVFNAVFASAFFMLLYSPRYLFDVGFQLSYAAVISILLFQKRIYGVFVVRNWMLRKVWMMMSVTLAAQLGTMPLTLYYFHQISNLFWLSSFIVIPIATILIYLSVLFWCVHTVPYVGPFLSSLLHLLVEVMNSSIIELDSWEAVRGEIRFECTDFFFLYLLLALVYAITEKFTVFRLNAMLSVLLVYAVGQTINKIFFVT